MRFRFESTVATRLETTFAFHEDPANLARLHTEWPGFRILHHSGNVRPGSETWFEQTIAHVVPVVMGFRHTAYDPPVRFAERMIHGPFLSFDHVHEFESIGQRVIVRDLLDVSMPARWGGDLLIHSCVAPMLRRVFDHRYRVLEQLLEELDAGVET